MPYLGEITMFACGFTPNYFTGCNGQLLPIPRNTALFSLIETTYGGNGTTTFAMPDLGGVSPLGAGQGPGLSPRDLGEKGGESYVVLNADQMASHSHHPAALSGAKIATPANDVWSNPGNERPIPSFYASQMVNPQAMNTGLIGATGGGGPHNNLMPFLVVTIGICTAGEFPPHG
ncbi:MAG TPA: tail fiber protein [Puia sp.]|jgi:microcystin-dependent protein|nr:tail fiber protein [Puia sp.]